MLLATTYLYKTKLNTRSKKALNSAVEVIARLERRKLVTSIFKFFYIISSDNSTITFSCGSTLSTISYTPQRYSFLKIIFQGAYVCVMTY